MPDHWFFTFTGYFADGWIALCRLPLSGFITLVIALSLPAFMAFTELRNALKVAANKQSELSNERFAEVIRPLYQRLDQTADVTSEFGVSQSLDQKVGLRSKLLISRALHRAFCV